MASSSSLRPGYVKFDESFPDALADATLHVADVDAVPLPRGRAAAEARERHAPFVRDEPAARAVLGEIIERSDGAPSSSGAALWTLGAAWEAGFPPAFHRAEQDGGGSVFRQRLAAAQATARGRPAAAAAAASEGAAALKPSVLLPASGALSERAALASAVGFSSSSELGALEASAAAQVNTLSPGEVNDALSEVRALLGEATYRALLARRSGGETPAPPRLPPPAAPAPPSSRPPPIDYSQILTEADLDAAASLYLPASELAKLEWTGIMPSSKPLGSSRHHGGSDGDSSGHVKGSAMEALDMEAAHVVHLPSLMGGESAEIGASATKYSGSGTAQALSQWAAAAAAHDDDDEVAGGGEGRDDDGGVSGSVQGGGRGNGDRGGVSSLVLTTDTAAAQFAALREALGLPSARLQQQQLARPDAEEGKGGSSSSSSSSTPASSVPVPADPSLRDLRFDFEGCLVQHEGGTVGVGLHHHGNDPDAAGYSLLELLGLARSAVSGQRATAFRVMAKLLRRRRGAFIDPLQPPPSPTMSRLAPPTSPTPWRYASAAWAKEGATMRSLLLPPLLPVILRLGCDEDGAAPLLHALRALRAFACEAESSEHATEVDELHTLFCAMGSAHHVAIAVHAFSEVAPLCSRPQPPVAHEGDWGRLEDRVLLPTQVLASGSEPHAPQRTAARALREGRAALVAPMHVLVTHMRLIPRVSDILGPWFVAHSSSSSGGGGGVGGGGALDVAIEALHILEASARTSLSAATLIARHSDVSVPRWPLTLVTPATEDHRGHPSQRRVQVGLLAWCAHVHLFSLPSEEEEERAVEGGEHLPLARLAAALLVLRTIHAVIAQGRGLAQELCDAGARGGGLGDAVAPVSGSGDSPPMAIRPPWVSVLSLDALLQYLPRSGGTSQCPTTSAPAAPSITCSSSSMLTTGAAWWAEKRGGAEGSGAQHPPASVSPRALLRLGLAWTTLRILRTCVSYGCGSDRVIALWPLLSRLVTPALRSSALIPRDVGDAIPPPPAARAAAAFAVALLDLVAACASGGTAESAAAARLLTPINTRKGSGVTRQQQQKQLQQRSESEGDDSEGEGEEEDGDALESGDAASLGQQAATLSTLVTASSGGWEGSDAALGAASLTASSRVDVALLSITMRAHQLRILAAHLHPSASPPSMRETSVPRIAMSSNTSTSAPTAAAAPQSLPTPSPTSASSSLAPSYVMDANPASAAASVDLALHTHLLPLLSSRSLHCAVTRITTANEILATVEVIPCAASAALLGAWCRAAYAASLRAPLILQKLVDACPCPEKGVKGGVALVDLLVGAAWCLLRAGEAVQQLRGEGAARSPSLVESTAAARSYDCQPLPYHAARPFAHAALSALTLLEQVSFLTPLVLPSPSISVLWSGRDSLRLLALLTPGDEAAALHLLSSTFCKSTTPHTSTSGSRQGTSSSSSSSSRASLLPLWRDGLLGGGSAPLAQRLVSASRSRLHSCLPGMLPVEVGSSEVVTVAGGKGNAILSVGPPDWAPRIAPKLVLGGGGVKNAAPHDGADSMGGEGDASQQPPTLMLLLALLPRPLRPTLGLPLGGPASPTAPCPPLLALPLAVSLVLSGAIDALVGDRARAALSLLRGASTEGGVGGGNGASPPSTAGAVLFTRLLEMAASHGGLAALLLDDNRNSNGHNVVHGAPPTSALLAAASLSSAAHALFLLLHTGCMPQLEVESGAALTALLRLHAACLETGALISLRAAQAHAGGGVPFALASFAAALTPTALLVAHPRAGAATLEALVGALGRAIVEDGPSAGGGVAACALLMLTQRGVVSGYTTTATASQFRFYHTPDSPTPPDAHCVIVRAVGEMLGESDGALEGGTSPASKPIDVRASTWRELVACGMARSITVTVEPSSSSPHSVVEDLRTLASTLLPAEGRDDPSGAFEHALPLLLCREGAAASTSAMCHLLSTAAPRGCSSLLPWGNATARRRRAAAVTALSGEGGSSGGSSPTLPAWLLSTSPDAPPCWPLAGVEEGADECISAYALALAHVSAHLWRKGGEEGGSGLSFERSQALKKLLTAPAGTLEHALALLVEG